MREEETADGVWLFQGDAARFSGGAFRSRAKAEQWIADHKLTGVLTLYPLDVGVYDWAIASGLFTPKKPSHHEPTFIAGFTTASQPHHHFQDGRRDAGD